MPLWVLALTRLNATSRSSEPSRSSGSKPSNASGGTGAWRQHLAGERQHQRPEAGIRGASAIDRSETAVAKSMAP